VPHPEDIVFLKLDNALVVPTVLIVMHPTLFAQITFVFNALKALIAEPPPTVTLFAVMDFVPTLTITL